MTPARAGRRNTQTTLACTLDGHYARADNEAHALTGEALTIRSGITPGRDTLHVRPSGRLTAPAVLVFFLIAWRALTVTMAVGRAFVANAMRVRKNQLRQRARLDGRME